MYEEVVNLGVSRNEANLPLEIQLIQKFFRQERQDRYISFISSKKKRKKFIQELSHLKDLQWHLFEEVSSFNLKQFANGKSNQSFYVISEDPSVDQTSVTAKQIEKLTDSGSAFILIFGEAEKIYYEGEPPSNRYISKRL